MKLRQFQYQNKILLSKRIRLLLKQKLVYKRYRKMMLKLFEIRIGEQALSTQKETIQNENLEYKHK